MTTLAVRVMAVFTVLYGGESLGDPVGLVPTGVPSCVSFSGPVPALSDQAVFAYGPTTGGTTKGV